MSDLQDGCEYLTRGGEKVRANFDFCINGYYYDIGKERYVVDRKGLHAPYDDTSAYDLIAEVV